MHLKIALNLLFVIVFLISSCHVSVNCNKEFDPHQEYPKYSIPEMVDSLVSIGVPRGQIIIPDSFLSVRLYMMNSGFVLNRQGEILDEFICHADFPYFQKNVINELQFSQVSKSGTQNFRTYINHMRFSTNEPFVKGKTYKYHLFMNIGSTESAGGEPMSFYLDALKSATSDSVHIFYVFPKNYKEFGLSSFEYNKRRLVVMNENGEDIPEEKLELYGVKEISD